MPELNYNLLQKYMTCASKVVDESKGRDQPFCLIGGSPRLGGRRVRWRGFSRSVLLGFAAFCFLSQVTLRNARGQTGSRASRATSGQAQQQAGLLNQEGMNWARQERYKEAAAAFQKAYALDPNNREIAFNYGLALERLGQCGGAIVPLKKAAEMPPDLAKPRVSLGGCYLDLGRTHEAVVQLEKGLADDPKNVSALFELSLAYHSLHDDHLANQRLLWMQERNPDSPLAYLFAARALRMTGQTVKAEKFITTAIKMDPKSAEAYFEQGFIEMLLEHPPLAEKSFLQAIRLSPELFGPNLKLGELYLEPAYKGDALKAIPYLKRAIQLSPGNPLAHLLLGQAYLRKSDLNQAELELRSSIQLDPKQSRAHYLLAMVLQRQGRKDEAAPEFQAADQLARDEASKQVENMKQMVKKAARSRNQPDQTPK